MATDVLRAIHVDTLCPVCCKVESLSLSLPLPLGVGELMLEQHHFSAWLPERSLHLCRHWCACSLRSVRLPCFAAECLALGVGGTIWSLLPIPYPRYRWVRLKCVLYLGVEHLSWGVQSCAFSEENLKLWLILIWILSSCCASLQNSSIIFNVSSTKSTHICHCGVSFALKNLSGQSGEVW